jgi:hypothetical protein
MVVTAKRDAHEHPSQLLSAIGSVLLFIGVAMVFAPELLRELLPPDVATSLLALGPALLMAGVAVEGYWIYRHLQHARARTKARAAESVAALDRLPDDLVARLTSWAPANEGGANFRTKRLVERSPSRLEVRTTAYTALFCGVFIVFGAGLGAAFAYERLSFGQSPLLNLTPILGSLAFAAAGVVMYYFLCRPAVFDRHIGWYWKGNPTLRAHQQLQSLTQATALSNIHALQLLSEYIPGDSDSSPYHSYELNLVLKNGRRLNVMDHGDLPSLMADAKLLARFLGVPLWELKPAASET